MGDEERGLSPSLLVSRSPALLFDAVGTLIYADPSPASAYEAIGRRFGSRLSSAEIAARFRRAFAAEEALDREQFAGVTDEARERRRWRAIVAAVLDDVAEREAAFAALWEHFARPASWRAYDDAEETIAALTARGHAVGVASNFDARLRPIIAAHFPAVRSEFVLASSELGYRKPSREFFAACAARLSAPSSQCVLVGDDVDNDFHGARGAGWSAIFLDRNEAHPALGPRVVDLRALLD
jgi:putative hydrolase of the HAD superfamily